MKPPNVRDYQSIGSRSENPADVRVYMSESWLNTNVKNDHGSPGAMTPQSYVSEGDTPSFLHLVNNGLDAHVDYTLGGWGGRSAYDDPAKKPNHITDEEIDDDGDDNKMYWRWVIAAQNDFAARMDWCVASSYSAANHQQVAGMHREYFDGSGLPGGMYFAQLRTASFSRTVKRERE